MMVRRFFRLLYLHGEEWGYIKNLPVDVSVTLERWPDGYVELTIHATISSPKGNKILVSTGVREIVLEALKRNRVAKHLIPIERLNWFLWVWGRYNLNYFQPGCPHQRENGWGVKTVEYGGVLRRTSTLTPEQHPEGVLGKPCPECGYRYGSDILCHEIPEDVVEELWEWLVEMDAPGEVDPGLEDSWIGPTRREAWLTLKEIGDVVEAWSRGLPCREAMVRVRRLVERWYR